MHFALNPHMGRKRLPSQDERLLAANEADGAIIMSDPKLFPPAPVPVKKESRIKLRFVALFALVLLIIWAVTGCVSTTTTSIAPDGTITNTETHRLELKPDTKRFFGDVARHKLGVPPRAEREGAK